MLPRLFRIRPHIAQDQDMPVLSELKALERLGKAQQREAY